VLLRESYRDEAGRAQKRTLANLSKLPGYVIDGLKALLKGGTVISTGPEEMQVERSLPHGHVAASLGMLRRIALDRLILSTAEGRGVATVLPSGGGDDRGSKLGFVRAVDGTAGRHRTRACPHPSRRSAAGTRGCAVPPRLPGGRRRAEHGRWPSISPSRSTMTTSHSSAGSNGSRRKLDSTVST
jgi:hypothetical protein